MTWKPRVIIAGILILTAMILSALGINTFAQQMGILAAGWLFGTVTPVK